MLLENGLPVNRLPVFLRKFSLPAWIAIAMKSNSKNDSYLNEADIHTEVNETVQTEYQERIFDGQLENRYPPASGMEENENPVAHVKTFKYYLDAGSEDILAKMKSKDLVIVEPVVMEEKFIKEAQKAGTLVYGYINSVEADNWNKDLIKKFDEEAFFHDNKGKRRYIPKWDAYLMDISNRGYQDILLKEIEEQIIDKGLDGVFLDTVGSIEDYHSKDPEVLEEQQLGMKFFVQRIKEQFPDLSVAQNWGFDTLENYTAPYMDFIMWEDFSASEIEADDWYAEKIAQLKRVRARYGVEVFAVSFRDRVKSAQIAKAHDFKIVHNPDGSYYNQWSEEETEEEPANERNDGALARFFQWISGWFGSGKN